MTDSERFAYAAGIIDGEGWVGIKRTSRKDMNSPSFQARIQVRMVDEGAIRFLTDTLGGSYYRESPHAAAGKPLFCWSIHSDAARKALRLVLPFLRIKRMQARKLLALQRLKARGHDHRTKVTGYREFPNQHGAVRQVPNLSYSDEFVGWCQQLYEDCKDLNAVGV